MQDITQTLLSFTEKHDLWTLSKKQAISSLDSYLEETKSNSLFKFNGLTSNNFILEEKSQELVFWQYDYETFLVRTVLSLFRDNSPNFEVGEFYLEVGLNAEIEDFGIIFH